MARNLQGKIEDIALLWVLYSVFFLEVGLVGLCDIVLKFRGHFAEWWNVRFFKKWWGKPTRTKDTTLVRRFYDLNCDNLKKSHWNDEKGFIKDLREVEEDRDRLEMACASYAATRQEVDDALKGFWDDWDSLSLCNQYRKMIRARAAGRPCGGHHAGFTTRLHELEKLCSRNGILPITTVGAKGKGDQDTVIRRRDAVEATRKKMGVQDE